MLLSGVCTAMLVVAPLHAQVEDFPRVRLTVHRGIGETRLPLAGLRSVRGEVDAMRGGIRVTGNDGFFSITGRFWNRTLGWHRAFATDLSRAVVLRYADRTIVITPHDPQHFIMRAGTFIKVAGFPK